MIYFSKYFWKEISKYIRSYINRLLICVVFCYQNFNYLLWNRVIAECIIDVLVIVVNGFVQDVEWRGSSRFEVRHIRNCFYRIDKGEIAHWMNYQRRKPFFRKCYLVTQSYFKYVLQTTVIVCVSKRFNCHYSALTVVWIGFKTILYFLTNNLVWSYHLSEVNIEFVFIVYENIVYNAYKIANNIGTV